MTPRLDPRDRGRHPVAPCGSTGPRPGCLPSCGRSTGLLRLSVRVRLLVGLRDPCRAPFSPRSRHRVRQHVGWSPPRPAPLRQVALRLPGRCGRAMRRTDFCHLTASYPYPRFVGSGPVDRLRGSVPRFGLISRQSHSLRRAAREPSRDRRWRALSSRRDACMHKPLTSLSPLAKTGNRSRACPCLVSRQIAFEPLA